MSFSLPSTMRKSTMRKFRGMLAVLIAASCVGLSLDVSRVDAQPATAESPIDFAHAVVPILKKHCLACHGGAESKGGFSLNTRELLMDAEAVIPGKSSESRMIELIASRDEEDQMPPKGRPRLSGKEVEVLKRWVDAGAEWEPGMTFAKKTYEPPLRPRHVALPAAVNGRTHPVDRIIDRYWRGQKKGAPLPAVSDAVFARRVHLDLVGLLPTAEELHAFLESNDPHKREQLIDSLLDNDLAYAEHWLTFWNDLLRNDYTGTGFITGGRKRITSWLYRALASNKPYDAFVRELIAPTAESEGFIVGIRWRGNVNSSQTPEVQFAQNVSQALLGINMKCASCHDSFIDRWTLEETYALAQVYSSVPLELHRCDKPTGKMAKAAWMFPELGQIDAAAPPNERLRQLSLLMTHPENGRLTRTVVNRIWHRLMGRGIVHPVDAMHTEPWSEDLLDYLASDFAAEGYDLRHVMRRICTSQAYQAAIPAATESLDPQGYIYNGPLPRRMTAEQFVDSVWQLTGAAPAKFDAKVLRVAPQHNASNESLPQRVGQWIWKDLNASSAAPGGERLAFRREFTIDAVPATAIAAITCDNSYEWWINGRKVGGDGNWETVEIVSIVNHLKPGKNELLVAAANGDSRPNPAGLMVEIHWKDTDGETASLGTDERWQWTKTQPDKRGAWPKGQDVEWSAAIPTKNPSVWSAANTQFEQALHLNSNATLAMVRASLVKNNSLMNALGRPNRDQIVTSRPSELTTLEAIDLANGQLLADAVAAGASRAIARGDNAAEFCQWLFQHALARPPTDEELQLAAQLLGEEMQPKPLEDLIWAVLMLPEFQLIR